MHKVCPLILGLLTLLMPAASPAAELASTPPGLVVTPATFSLRGAHSVQRLLVTTTPQNAQDFRSVDLSRDAVYASSDPKVATVSTDGVVSPRGNGSAEIRVTFRGRTALARVRVVEMDVEQVVSFRNQIVPIFTKLGCNAGGCHGKATGQNGFKLSLLGFDPEFDYAAIVKEARGRRVFPAAPERSLLLLKASRRGAARRRPQADARTRPNTP